MPLATLSIDLVAKLAQFERDLGRSARVAEQNAERMRVAFAKVGTGLTAVLSGVGVGAITAIVRAQVDAIDGFNDLKDATGASIENISALDSLARRTGVTFDTVGSSLIKFNAALKEANDPEKGAGKVFKALGLDVEKLKQLDPAEALRQTAVALSGFADDGNKARAVQELFGKSLREVAPLLKDLAEEGTLAAKVTTEQAEAAEKFNKELFKMSASITDIARDISGPLVTAFNTLIDRLREGKKDGDSFYTTLLKLSSGIPLPQIALPGQIASLYDQSQGGNSGKLSNIEQALKDPTLSPQERAALVSRAAALRSRVTEQNAGQMTAAETFRRSEIRQTKSLNIPDDKKKGKKGPDLAKQGKELALSLTAQDSGLSPDFFDKWEKLTAAYKGNEISLAGLTEAQALLLKQQPFMKSEQFAGDVSDALSRRTDAMERSRKAVEDLNAEIDRLADGGDGRKRQLTEALEARLNAGEVFSKEELDRIVRGIGGVSEAVAEAKKTSIDFADVFESSFERAVVKGEKLSGVLKSLAQDIATLYLRENVTKPLAKGASDWFGSVMGGFKFGGGGGSFDMAAAGAMDNFLGFARGGVMTSRGAVPLRTYANGGVANSPQLAMFGEGSMAEAYVPLPDGRRIPVAMKGGGGRPVTIHNHLTVGDVASMAQVQEQLRASERRSIAAFRRAQTYGMN